MRCPRVADVPFAKAANVVGNSEERNHLFAVMHVALND